MSPSRNTAKLDTGDLHTESLLLQAADEFTESAQRGEQPDIEDFARRYPALADTIRRVFPALASLHDPPTAPAAVFNVVDEPLGDFQVIEEIGRGGMGIVYRATEVSLDRSVALKVLPLAGMLNEQTLSRFKNEARAAASLSHPHIVPVYSVGEEHGVHYYAMRLIDGRSIADLIEEMRREIGTSCDGDSLSIAPGRPHTNLNSLSSAANGTPNYLASCGSPAYFRRVASWGVDAARALAHAHTHGVLHRDIKPANLMIDTSGHLWVTDFGLARLDGDVGISVSGDLLGTFRYMSPEQALGRRILIDRRSDVYSLAVTMYELLTLQPVFSSDNTLELLRQIAFEDPLSPRKLNRSIPIELDTILMKGMEKDPQRRYAGAEEFADDLQRYLDHRPVVAKPPTLVERATKWSLRHQAAVWASVATLGIAIAALTVSTFVIARAYTIAHEQRLRAENHLRLAREVIDDNYSKEIEALKHEPGMTQEQRRSILRLVQFYEQLPEEDLANPLLRHDACKARLNLADVYLVLGQPRKAIQTYRQVVDQAKELRQRQPANAIFQHTLAMAHDGLGQALYAIQDYQPSIEAHRQASALAQHLRQQFPRDLTFHRLAVSQVHLARAYRDTETKEQTLRSAIRTLEQLARKFPDEPLFESYLGGAQGDLGLLLRATGRHREAESQLRKAIDVHGRLADSSPRLPSHRYQLAKTKSHLATLLSDLRRQTDAEIAHREAVSLLKELSEQYPHRVLFHSELAKSHHELGTLLASNRRHADAAESLQEAIALLEPLTVDTPEAPEYQADLAANYRDLGVVMMRLGDGKSARKLLADATEIWHALEQKFPDEADYQKNLAIVNSYSSRFLDLDDRLAAYQDTVQVLTGLARRFPERIEYRQLLIQFTSSLGLELRAAGELEKAENHFLHAIRIADAFSKTNPELPLYHEAAGQFTAFGDLSRELGKFKQSAQAHQTAVENYRILRELFPDKAEYRIGLCSNLKRLGYARSRAGHFDEALQSYTESIRLAKELLRDYPQQAEFVGKLSRRYQLLGMLHLDAGNHAEAEQAFRNQWHARTKLMSDFPKYKVTGIPNPQLLAMLANIVLLEDPKRWQEAAKLLRSAGDLSVEARDLLTSIRLQLLLADVYQSNDQGTDAKHAIDTARDQVAELETKELEADEALRLSLHSSRWHVALAMNRNGDAASARPFLEHVLNQELKDVTWKSVQAWFLATWPEARPDQLEWAQMLAEEVTLEAPDNSHYWSLLGIAQYRRGQHAAAAQSLSKSVNLSNNSNFFTQLYLALARARLGEVQAAIEVAEQVESRLLLGHPFNTASYRRLLDEFDQLIANIKTS